MIEKRNMAILKERLFDAASDLESIAGSLEDLLNLIFVYEEHSESELDGIDPNEPCSILPLITRQGMGDALIDCIREKARSILEHANNAQQKGYAAVQESKNRPFKTE